MRTAYSGCEALTIVTEFHPHFALLDIGMPGISGYERAGEIRSQSWGDDVILVAVTGWGQSEDKRRAEGASFNYHLTKPVDFDALERLLNDHFDSVTRTLETHPTIE